MQSQSRSMRMKRRISGWLMLFGLLAGGLVSGCTSPVAANGNQPRTASDFIGRPRPAMP